MSHPRQAYLVDASDSGEAATFVYQPGLLTATTASGRRLEIPAARVRGRFLERLVSTPRRLVTGQQLVDYCYGEAEGPVCADQCIRVFALWIRNVLRKAGLRPYLATYWGEGYMWMGETTLTKDSPLVLGFAVQVALSRLLASHGNRPAAEDMQFMLFGHGF